MNPFSRTTWIRSLLCLAILVPAMLSAQGRFTVNGRLKIEGGDLSSSRMVVYKNGVKERTLSTGLNKFSLDLELNANYIVSFEKDGYVAKKVSFNTNAPAEAIASGFTPFDFAVSLFKQYDDINIVVFNQPVGIIRYDDKTGDFDYDTDYTKSIQSQLQQVLTQVEQKQKEESVNEKERAAQEAAAAKAKAKEEADAAKQAAAKAKADAEAQREAEALAKVEEKKAEEQKKAEEKKRQEQLATSPPPPVKEKDPESVVAEQRKPEPKVEPVVKKPEPQVVNAIGSKAVTNEDGRRSVDPIVQEEENRVAMAKVVVKEESPVRPAVVELEVFRKEELVVEPSRVTTVVTITTGERFDEYRKVTHKWGGLYYFKNGAACSKEVFDSEARDEQLAGATPRSKMD
jgi:flagellar biosynthesis GTPase FlhF